MPGWVSGIERLISVDDQAWENQTARRKSWDEPPALPQLRRAVAPCSSKFLAAPPALRGPIPESWITVPSGRRINSFVAKVFLTKLRASTAVATTIPKCLKLISYFAGCDSVPTPIRGSISRTRDTSERKPEGNPAR